MKQSADTSAYTDFFVTRQIVHPRPSGTAPLSLFTHLLAIWNILLSLYHSLVTRNHKSLIYSYWFFCKCAQGNAVSAIRGGNRVFSSSIQTSCRYLLLTLGIIYAGHTKQMRKSVKLPSLTVPQVVFIRGKGAMFWIHTGVNLNLIWPTKYSPAFKQT